MSQVKERSDLAADAEILWLSQQLAVQDDPLDRALAQSCLEELARDASPCIARRAAGALAASLVPPQGPAAPVRRGA